MNNNIVTGRALRRLGFGHVFRVLHTNKKYNGFIILTIGNKRMFIAKDERGYPDIRQIQSSWKYEYIGQLRKQ